MRSLTARAIILGMALALLVTVRVLGAMNASIAPISGPPEQTVTLQTVGVAGAYDGVDASGSTSIFVVDPGITDAAVCTSAHVHEIGPLTWTGWRRTADLLDPSVARRDLLVSSSHTGFRLLGRRRCLSPAHPRDHRSIAWLK